MSSLLFLALQICSSFRYFGLRISGFGTLVFGASAPCGTADFMGAGGLATSPSGWDFCNWLSPNSYSQNRLSIKKEKSFHDSVPDKVAESE